MKNVIQYFYTLVDVVAYINDDTSYVTEPVLDRFFYTANFNGNLENFVAMFGGVPLKKHEYIAFYGEDVFGNYQEVRFEGRHEHYYE